MAIRTRTENWWVPDIGYPLISVQVFGYPITQLSLTFFFLFSFAKQLCGVIFLWFLLLVSGYPITLISVGPSCCVAGAQTETKHTWQPEPRHSQTKIRKQSTEHRDEDSNSELSEATSELPKFESTEQWKHRPKQVASDRLIGASAAETERLESGETRVRVWRLMGEWRGAVKPRRNLGLQMPLCLIKPFPFSRIRYLGLQMLNGPLGLPACGECWLPACKSNHFVQFTIPLILDRKIKKIRIFG